MWQATQDPQATWPAGVRLQGGSMIYEGKICVPENHVENLVNELHGNMGHIGVNRLVREIQKRYAIPPSVRIFEKIKEVHRKCVTCQVCDTPNFLHPIPDDIMTSVALDVLPYPTQSGWGRTLIHVWCVWTS